MFEVSFTTVLGQNRIFHEILKFETNKISKISILNIPRVDCVCAPTGFCWHSGHRCRWRLRRILKFRPVSKFGRWRHWTHRWEEAALRMRRAGWSSSWIRLPDSDATDLEKSGILGNLKRKMKKDRPCSESMRTNEEIEPIFVKWSDKHSAKSRQFVNDEHFFFIIYLLFPSFPTSNYRFPSFTNCALWISYTHTLYSAIAVLYKKWRFR